jgi:hypothetical protein
LILDIYSGISGPRRFEYAMACAVLPRRAKVVFTDFFEIRESNPFGIGSHFLQDLGYATHIEMVSLLIP